MAENILSLPAPATLSLPSGLIDQVTHGWGKSSGLTISQTSASKACNACNATIGARLLQTSQSALKQRPMLGPVIYPFHPAPLKFLKFRSFNTVGTSRSLITSLPRKQGPHAAHELLLRNQ
ncbi:uncharacterized protein RAG0_05210 [Rhynchosporium agropyri]|uniref:Uncharacterized protein n=1 Tax=Rhynchosporium agropyri TaxID=914238 RepID=A0A1E1KC22_9HELO|nr:uncharacterized protein RAG0_05210 [Rhynchosporium agropyri]